MSLRKESSIATQDLDARIYRIKNTPPFESPLTFHQAHNRISMLQTKKNKFTIRKRDLLNPVLRPRANILYESGVCLI